MFVNISNVMMDCYLISECGIQLKMTGWEPIQNNNITCIFS